MTKANGLYGIFAPSSSAVIVNPGCLTVVERVTYPGGKRAVKSVRCLPPEPTRADVVEITGRQQQLDDEARILSQLPPHPNIVRLRAVEHSADGRVRYISLDWLNGEQLAARTLMSGAIWRELVGWMRDLASALAHLETHGIVHRDVKPANCLVVDRRAVLIDFGVAIKSELWRPLPSVFGTAGYIPLELLDGKPPTTAADVWALGQVMLGLMGYGPRQQLKGELLVVYAMLMAEMPPPQLSGTPEVPAEYGEFVYLVECCRHEDPAKRPTPQEIVDFCTELLAKLAK